MRTLFLLGFFCSALSLGETQTFECQIGFNWKAKIELDTTTHKLSAQSNQGAKWEGKANYYYSPKYKRHWFFLPTGYSHGIELQFPYQSVNRARMCLSPEDCTLCKMGTP